MVPLLPCFFVAQALLPAAPRLVSALWRRLSLEPALAAPGTCLWVRAATRQAVRAKHSRLGCQLIAGMKLAERHIRGEVALPLRYVEAPESVNVRAIRERSGLSQTEFARRYGISPRSLQEWEQGRRQPEGAVRAYLLVIDRNPHAVENALQRPR